MTLPRSIVGRLIAGAAIFVILALVFAGVVIGFVLDHFVRGQIDERLDGQLRTVAESLRVEPSQGLVLDRNVDAPPFDRPRSGWYWQAFAANGSLARSRSLGEATLAVPDGHLPRLAAPPPPPPEPRGGPPLGPPHGARPEPPLTFTLSGPDEMALHARAVRTLIGPMAVVLVVSAPVMALHGPVRAALATVALSLGGLGLGLILAVVGQVRLGLAPLTSLRARLVEVRQGRLQKIPEDQPREIKPLVVELNALLAENAENLNRARRHVSNLAHGLKTPLATLSLALDGPARDPGGHYRALLDQMDRQVRHHLGRARAAALGGAVRVETPLAPLVADLLDAFGKIHADRALVFDVAPLGDVALACDRQDVEEMLGNLLDNACRHAGQRVRLDAEAAGRQALIRIEDDGSGLTEDAMPEAMRPGHRLDESTPGYGFGLPITRDLAALYGGTLTLDRSALGGLRATLTLPAAGSLVR